MASALGGGLDSAEAGVAGIMAAMPPQYVEFKEQIRLEMLNIKQRMGELRGMHGRATLSRFDDTNEDELQVEVLTQQITKMFRKCEARLQQFGGEPSASAADDKVKRNVQRTLAVELQRLSIQFRKQQKAYLNRLRSKDGGGAGGGGSSFDLLGDGQQGRQQQDDYDPGFSDMQALKVDNLTSLIDERDREVQNIVSSINELAQIMKDLSVLVIDQGTILDRIDYNMEQTSMKVEEGVRQLEKAEKKQKQSRMVLCIMLLLCAVVVMLLLVVFKAIFLR
jgi:syntaxin 16